MKYLYLIFLSTFLFAGDEMFDQKVHELMKSMDSMMNSDLGTFNKLAGPSLEMKWVEKANSVQELIIDLPHENQKLDIKVNDNRVAVSGELKIEKTEKNKYGESRSTSIQTISRSMSLPVGCSSKDYETNKVGKKLTLSFKCKGSLAKKYKKVSDPNAIEI